MRISKGELIKALAVSFLLGFIAGTAVAKLINTGVI